MFILITWRDTGARGRERIDVLRDRARFIENSKIVSPAALSREELSRFLEGISDVENSSSVEQVLAWTEGVPLRVRMYAERLKPEPQQINAGNRTM